LITRSEVSLDPTVIIIGSVADAHVQSVCSRLPQASIPAIIDLSKYLSTYAASIEYGPNGQAALQLFPSEYRTLESVKAIWWRRPLAFNSKASEKELSRFFECQFEFFWTSFLSFLPKDVRWYNDWRADYAIDRNASQLRIAHEFGLKIPETLITSCPSQAKRFVRDRESAVFKSFGGSVTYWEPTMLASSENLEQLWLLGPRPVIFQEYIAGPHDYRVIIIDDKVFSVEFDTEQSAYRYDVRVDVSTPCRTVGLEEVIVEKLKAMLKHLGLRYGAFDLRRNRTGDLVFFELNPAGQFLYLDRRAGTNISAAMAGALSATY
jgi:hypothetical protein